MHSEPSYKTQSVLLYAVFFYQISVRFKIYFLCHNLNVTGSCISFNALLFCGKINVLLA